MTRRKFDPDIISLLHFDYPYYNESFDACRDEINGEIFSRTGAKFCGTEIPCDEIISGTPKFGYRCLHTESNSQYISAKQSGLFNLSISQNYELECFIRVTSSNSGNIIVMLNGSTTVLTLSKNTDNQIVFSSSALNFSITSSAFLSLNTWTHIKAALNNGSAIIYVNGEQSAIGGYTKSDRTVSEIRLGGIAGMIDEFVFRKKITDNVVPSEPYQAECDLESFGGFSESTNALTIPAGIFTPNSYAIVSSASGTKITLSNINAGKYASFSSGSEVMFHVSEKLSSSQSDLGKYVFRKIVSVSGSVITIDSAVLDEFNLNATFLKNYVVQAIAVLNAGSIALSSSAYLRPLSYTQKSGGGIIAIRTKGNITMSKSYILSHGYGPERNDTLRMTHSDLPDRFLINKGGGIFISCGGTLSADSTSRIGAEWSGVLSSSERSHGGAGYGGAGGSDYDNGGIGGLGGVGGGGGGADGAYGGNAGSAGSRLDNRYYSTGNPGTGGAAGQYSSSRDGIGNAGDGGTAGVNVNSPDQDKGSSGGAGAGGNAGNAYHATKPAKGGKSGACAIIIAHTLKLPEQVISTGGESGEGPAHSSGGGGTGFAYLACGEMI